MHQAPLLAVTGMAEHPASPLGMLRLCRPEHVFLRHHPAIRNQYLTDFSHLLAQARGQL
jgi:hypothetical protein